MRQLWDETKATASNVSAISRKEPKPPPNHCDILQNREWFAIMSLELWHRKVAAHLHALFVEAGGKDYSERTIYAWTGDGHEPSAGVLAFLLRSSDGGRVLTWVMRGCEQPWWLRHERAERIYKMLEAELR